MGAPCYIISMIKTLPLLNLNFLPAGMNVSGRFWPKTQLLSTYFGADYRNTVLRGGGGDSPQEQNGQKMTVTQKVSKRIDGFAFVYTIVSAVSLCFLCVLRFIGALQGASRSQIVAGYPLSARSSKDVVAKVSVRDSIIRHSNFLYSMMGVRGVGSRWAGCTHIVNRGLTVRELISKELFIAFAELLVVVGFLRFFESLGFITQGLRFRLRSALLIGLSLSPRKDTFVAKVNRFRVAGNVSEQGFKAVTLCVNALVKSNCLLWIASVRRKFFDGFGKPLQIVEVQARPAQCTKGDRGGSIGRAKQYGRSLGKFGANCNQVYTEKKAPDKTSEAKDEKDYG